MVSTLPRLCVLDISCNSGLAQEVDGGGFGELAASLSHAVGLHTLRLQACGLRADSLKDIGAFPVDTFAPCWSNCCYCDSVFLSAVLA